MSERLYLVGEPPNESCPHFHEDCKRLKTNCPIICNRYNFYEDLYKEDEEDKECIQNEEKTNQFLKQKGII